MDIDALTDRMADGFSIEMRLGDGDPPLFYVRISRSEVEAFGLGKSLPESWNRAVASLRDNVVTRYGSDLGLFEVGTTAKGCVACDSASSRDARHST